MQQQQNFQRRNSSIPNKSSNPKKRKLEFSKLLFISIFILVISICAFSCALMWRTGDTAPLAYLIPSAFSALAVTTGFYSWKAKAENVIKLLKQHGTVAEKAIKMASENNNYNNYSSYDTYHTNMLP